jgi:hypothetical protein
LDENDSGFRHLPDQRHDRLALAHVIGVPDHSPPISQDEPAAESVTRASIWWRKSAPRRTHDVIAVPGADGTAIGPGLVSDANGCAKSLTREPMINPPVVSVSVAVQGDPPRQVPGVGQRELRPRIRPPTAEIHPHHFTFGLVIRP